MKPLRIIVVFYLLLVIAEVSVPADTGQSLWQKLYTGAEATGENVIALRQRHVAVSAPRVYGACSLGGKLAVRVAFSGNRSSGFLPPSRLRGPAFCATPCQPEAQICRNSPSRLSAREEVLRLPHKCEPIHQRPGTAPRRHSFHCLREFRQASDRGRYPRSTGLLPTTRRFSEIGHSASSLGLPYGSFNITFLVCFGVVIAVTTDRDLWTTGMREVAVAAFPATVHEPGSDQIANQFSNFSGHDPMILRWYQTVNNG